jgi:SAM-dependent methyltransferase
VKPIIKRIPNITKKMNNSDYRSRIYRYYVKASQQTLAPENIQGLMPRAPMLRKIIREHFPLDRTVTILDLGCGHGAFIHFIREAGYTNVSGIDRSPEQVAEAKRLGIDGVHQGDLMKTLGTHPDESHDMVVAFDVIEHFTKEELLPLIDEVHRILRKGGRWILHQPNAVSPFFGRVRYGDYTHEQIFTPDSLNQLLLISGFKEVRCFEDEPLVHGFKSSLRWVAWKMIRSLLRAYLAAEAGKTNEIFSQNFLAVARK